MIGVGESQGAVDGSSGTVFGVGARVAASPGDGRVIDGSNGDGAGCDIAIGCPVVGLEGNSAIGGGGVFAAVGVGDSAQSGLKLRDSGRGACGGEGENASGAVRSRRYCRRWWCWCC